MPMHRRPAEPRWSQACPLAKIQPVHTDSQIAGSSAGASSYFCIDFHVDISLGHKAKPGKPRGSISKRGASENTGSCCTNHGLLLPRAYRSRPMVPGWARAWARPWPARLVMLSEGSKPTQTQPKPKHNFNVVFTLDVTVQLVMHEEGAAQVHAHQASPRRQRLNR